MVKTARTKKTKVSKIESDFEIAEKTGEPVVRKGSHLTVTTYPDGKQDLKWDDQALARDVKNAIDSITMQGDKK